MLKIGEFSRLSHLTVKALRFYEKEGLLMPTSVDAWTGYRFYEITQLSEAACIKRYRELDFTIDEIKELMHGGDERALLLRKAKELSDRKQQLEGRLSSINLLLEGKEMKYQVELKEAPACIVYTAEKRLKHISDIMTFIPSCGEACLALNPGLQCAEPPYEFCEYPDEEFHETNVLVRHSEAVTEMGKGSDFIKFRKLPAVKVLSALHKGPYSTLPNAYAAVLKYAETNGYTCAGLFRECYIDGIWNKESEEEWLTEVQLPIA